jgi:hypothetical protein
MRRYRRERWGFVPDRDEVVQLFNHVPLG